MSTESVDISWPKKVVFSIVLLACGLLVFVFGSNYYSIFPTNNSQIYRVALAAIFLAAAIVLRRNQAWKAYGRIAYAFFVAITAFFVTSLTSGARDSLLSTLEIPASDARYISIEKVFEAVLVVSVILILTALWREDMGSLYLKKGRLGLGLLVGVSLLTINTATGIVTGATLGHTTDVLIARLPWLLLFSLANGFMEELWFRGLFFAPFCSGGWNSRLDPCYGHRLHSIACCCVVYGSY